MLLENLKANGLTQRWLDNYILPENGGFANDDLCNEA